MSSTGLWGCWVPSQPKGCEPHQVIGRRNALADGHTLWLAASPLWLSVLCFSNSNWFATTPGAVLLHFCYIKLDSPRAQGLWSSLVLRLGVSESISKADSMQETEKRMVTVSLCFFAFSPWKLHSDRRWVNPVASNARCKVHVLSN